ncbi:RDD family protein [Actinorhabdospora filicis]|uniref:RDD family protein n=1 Tax=Actinorhabdospora filicis TaxID=1785913 RepID=UPI0025526ED0|nr:RDD family protein [Actinorhabdospora filicis]
MALDTGSDILPGRFVSGEAVELDVRVARLGSRMLAFSLDLVVIATGFMVLLPLSLYFLKLMMDVGAIVDGALFSAVVLIDLVIMFLVVPATVETMSKGRSLGKLATGLRVVRDDGGPIRFRHAFVRALVGVALEFPGLLLPGVTWLVGLWTMLVNPAGKRLGDLAAGTVIIHERSPAVWGWAPLMPPPLATWATLLDMSNLDDELALDVRHFLSRNTIIGEPARTALGQRLAAELAAKVTPQPPAGTPGWAFMSAVLAERHRRNAARLAASRAVTAQVWDTLYGPRPVS